MITAIIHYTLPNGSEDSIVLSGTEDEIREAALDKLKKTGGTAPWSEIVSEEK